MCTSINKITTCKLPDVTVYKINVALLKNIFVTLPANSVLSFYKQPEHRETRCSIWNVGEFKEYFDAEINTAEHIHSIYMKNNLYTFSYVKHKGKNILPEIHKL